MGRRDRIFLGLFAVLLLGMTGKAVFTPGLALGNFGDVYPYHHPLRHAAASALQEGRLPLWNPYIFCGLPLAANPQAALFMPLSVLSWTFDILAALDAGWLLYLAGAFLGSQLLARRWGLSPAGAGALAAGFALHPFVLYRVPQGIPTHLAALAFVPWSWLAAEDLAASGVWGLGSGVRSRTRNPETRDPGPRTPWPAVFFALVIALQGLSGHPQFAVINLAGMTLYLALRRPRALAALAAGLGLAALLTAAQWLPTLEFLSRSIRMHWTALYATAYSLPPSWLATMLRPGALGSPLDPGFRGWPSEFFEMAGLYPGLAALALAGAGLLAGRRAAALWALAAAGLFLALGGYNPLMRALLERPGFGSLRVPARWYLLTLWALWMAGCMGWRRMTEGLRAKGQGLRGTLVWAQAAVAIFVVADLVRWDAKFLYAQETAPFLAAGGKVLAPLRASRQRYATAPDIPNPNKGMLYRLPNVTGYEAFYLAGAALHAGRTQRRPSADGSHTYIEDFAAPGFKDVGLRLYLGAQVREVPDAQPLAYHEDASYPDPDAPRIVAMEPERWKLLVEPRESRVESPGAADSRRATRDARSSLILAQAYYPGWKAWLDGVPVPVGPHEGFLQRIRLHDPGTRSPNPAPRQLVLRFDPGLWTLARWLSILTVLALCAGSISVLKSRISMLAPELGRMAKS